MTTALLVAVGSGYLTLPASPVHAFSSYHRSSSRTFLQSAQFPVSSRNILSYDSKQHRQSIAEGVHQQRNLHRLYSSTDRSQKDDLAVKGGRGEAPPFSVTLEEQDYSYRDAIQRTLGWVGAAIVFGGGLWSVFGNDTGEEFFAGYLVEQSLSVDNLFVFLLLFEYFKVPLPYQDRVLNWGIYGAVVMRAIMIGLGAAAIHNFHEILLVFAAILVYSSGKVLLGDDDEEEDPSQNSIVKFSRSLINSTDYFDGDRFFTLADGVRKATPLFICMIAVEISDIVFAVDSIPAVFGVTEVRADLALLLSRISCCGLIISRNPCRTCVFLF